MSKKSTKDKDKNPKPSQGTWDKFDKVVDALADYATKRKKPVSK